MTIKDFAALCNCNPQTLRYYDRIGLLKPDEVDSWTGYRYYKENQALDFLKIKKLQEAEFSIEEIRELLLKSDDEVYHAFDRKIEEQMAKLEQIRKIQSTYLSEKQSMEATIREIREKVMASARNYNPEDEFGISGEDYKKLLDKASDYFEASIKSSNTFEADFSDVEVSDGDDIAEEENYDNPLKNDRYSIVYEKHGWEKTKEALANLPKLDDAEYLFYFEVEKSKRNSVAFCNVIIGYALDENEGKRLTLGCNCVESQDGRNHFWLLKALPLF